MIKRSLGAVREHLQSYFDSKDPENHRKISVVLSNLLNQDGKQQFEEVDPDASSHFLVLTLVNIEQENHLKPPPQVKPLGNFYEGKVGPPQNVNIYFLASAYSSQYDTALSVISETIAFFQKKPYFDSSNTPSLHPGIKRMIADLHTLTFEQQNYLWGLMGAKYMPSVLYKLRTLSIAEEDMTQVGKPVLEINFPGLE